MDVGTQVICLTFFCVSYECIFCMWVILTKKCRRISDLFQQFFSQNSRKETYCAFVFEIFFFFCMRANTVVSLLWIGVFYFFFFSYCSFKLYVLSLGYVTTNESSCNCWLFCLSWQLNPQAMVWRHYHVLRSVVQVPPDLPLIGGTLQSLMHLGALGMLRLLI